jgi:hypothetical protein
VEKDQQERFKEAVERKARASDEAARATPHGSPGEASGIDGDQENLHSASQPQDTVSARDKNTRHRKVTADKWNQ